MSQLKPEYSSNLQQLYRLFVEGVIAYDHLSKPQNERDNLLSKHSDFLLLNKDLIECLPPVVRKQIEELLVKEFKRLIFNKKSNELFQAYWPMLKTIRKRDFFKSIPEDKSITFFRYVENLENDEIKDYLPNELIVSAIQKITFDESTGGLIKILEQLKNNLSRTARIEIKNLLFNELQKIFNSNTVESADLLIVRLLDLIKSTDNIDDEESFQVLLHKRLKFTASTNPLDSVATKYFVPSFRLLVKPDLKSDLYSNLRDTTNIGAGDYIAQLIETEKLENFSELFNKDETIRKEFCTAVGKNKLWDKFTAKYTVDDIVNFGISSDWVDDSLINSLLLNKSKFDNNTQRTIEEKIAQNLLIDSILIHLPIQTFIDNFQISAVKKNIFERYIDLCFHDVSRRLDQLQNAIDFESGLITKAQYDSKVLTSKDEIVHEIIKRRQDAFLNSIGKKISSKTRNSLHISILNELDLITNTDPIEPLISLINYLTQELLSVIYKTSRVSISSLLIKMLENHRTTTVHQAALNLISKLLEMSTTLDSEVIDAINSFNPRPRNIHQRNNLMSSMNIIRSKIRAN